MNYHGIKYTDAGIEDIKVKNLAWKCFEKTGDIEYYILYKDLK